MGGVKIGGCRWQGVGFSGFDRGCVWVRIGVCCLASVWGCVNELIADVNHMEHYIDLNSLKGCGHDQEYFKLITFIIVMTFGL